MDFSVAIVQYPLIFSRPTNQTNGPINEPPNNYLTVIHLHELHQQKVED